MTASAIFLINTKQTCTWFVCETSILTKKIPERKMNPVVVIVGANGWIGQQCAEHLAAHDKKPTVKAFGGRATDYAALVSFLRECRATHLLSTMGRTHGNAEGKHYPSIDYLELPGKLVENMNDNLLGPVTMMKIAHDLGIHFTYMGTGCIFEYDAAHPEVFGDDDLPNFFGSQYSVVKGVTDRIAHLFGSETLNLRIRMPISSHPHPRDFITKITGYTNICPRENSMTVLDDLLPVAVDLMLSGVVGTVNLVNQGTMNHQEILKIYARYVDTEHKWNVVTGEEHDKLLKSKRSNNHLQPSKVLEKYNIPTLEQSINRILSNPKY